jgi:membrane protease subunit (stomatin/prohibitin family)
MAKYIEVIEWKDDTGDQMVYRFEPGGELMLGAQLVVFENQWVVFFRDGKALDVFEAGRHTLTTANLPLLRRVVNLPFGGTSPFRADVYFVNRKVFTDMKWGTKQPVAFHDSELDIVRLSAFGIFAIRVVNPQLFINTMVGSQGIYLSKEVERYLKDMIVARLNDVLGENLKTVFELPKYYDELAAALKGRLKDDLDKYGIDLIDFFINSITTPPDVQKIIDERSGMAAVGDMGRFMKFKAAKALEEAAKAGDTAGGTAAAGMGLGVGAGMGMMIPGMLKQAMTEAGEKVAEKSICPHCKADIPPGSKFCPHCGQKITVSQVCPKCKAPISPADKFCPQCGAKLKD